MPTPFAVHYYATTAGTPRIEVRPVEDVPAEYAGDDEQFCPPVRETIAEYRTRIERERNLDLDEDDTHGEFGGERVAYLGFHAPETVAAFAYRDEEPDPRLDATVARYTEYQTIDGIGLATRLGVSLVELGAMVERDPRFGCAGSPWTPWVDPEGGDSRGASTNATAEQAALSEAAVDADGDANVGADADAAGFDTTTDTGTGTVTTTVTVADADGDADADAETDTNADADADTDGFDPNLRAELERGAYGTPGDALPGEIRGASQTSEGPALLLRVWVPFADETTDDRGETFGEYLSLPAPDDALSESKFGRLLLEHGYARASADQLIGEEVACVYRGGEWRVVDPEDADSTGTGTGTETETTTATALLSRAATGLKPDPHPRMGRTGPTVLPVVLAIACGVVLSVAGNAVGLAVPSGSLVSSSTLFAVGGVVVIVWALLFGTAALVSASRSSQRS